MENKSYNSFYTSENDLSTRSLNVLKKLGGTEQMLLHYKTFNSFQNIEKSGVLVNKELSSYCQYLLHIANQIENKAIEKISNEEYDLILHVYYNEGKFLNYPTKNIISKIEHLARFNESIEHRRQFLKKYFLEDFNFKEIEGLGRKGIRDLEDFRKVVLNYKSLYINYKPKEELVSNSIIDALYSFFEMKYPKHELNTFVDGEFYNFQRILIIRLSFSFNRTQSKIYWQYYFEHKHISLSELANNLSCSRELARIYIRSFENKILSDLCASIKFNLGENYYDIPKIDSSIFLNFDNFEAFEFDGKKYTPNLEFTRLVYGCLFGDNYIIFDQLIKEAILLNKSFELKGQNLFISRSFVNDYNIKGLLNFLNEEIYNFETAEFDYNLEILIGRFFIENNIEIKKSLILSIQEKLILKVKKDDWDLSLLVSKKHKKQEYKNKIINITFDYLKLCDTAQKTKSIIENLARNQILIDKLDILRLLNGQTSTFIRFGNGLWGLTEWQVEMNLKGSLREIVEDILEAKDVPVHISEILATINKIRPITSHSLNSNLRANEHNTFKFFNCAYIGLNSKKYDDYWHQIPRFNPHHLIQARSKNYKFKPLIDIIDFICEKYGYPKEHVKYILTDKLK